MSTGQPKTMRLAEALASDYLSALDAKFNGEKHHLPSGFGTLDKSIPGWLHNGHLIIVAGRPGMGKSAFAQQIAEAVAQQERTVILYTLEMSSYEITERSIARRSNIPVPTLKTAESLSEGEWDRISRAAAQFAPLPLLVDDASFDIAGMVGKTKAAAAGLEKAGLPPLGCVIVDYLQLIGARAANRTLEIGQITGNLKRLAKELDVPVIALAQLNRSLEQRPNKRPLMSDLRESGSIEQDADLILFIYRDEVYNPASEFKGMAEIIVGKNRHGSAGTVTMAFVGERVMFGDIAVTAATFRTPTPASASREEVRHAVCTL